MGIEEMFPGQNGMNNSMGAIARGGQQNAQQNMAQPASMGGFGDYVRQSGVPIWMGILNAIANPEGALKQTISGYQQYKQESQVQDLFRKVDNLLINDPEVKNADWSDPSFGRNIQKLLIKRGIPGNIADDILDQYKITVNDEGITTAMYYDTKNQTLVGHSQIELGKIISGERYAKVDLNLAKSNAIYRNYLVQTYPGIKKWVTDELGGVASDKAALAKFRKDFADPKIGPDVMIKQMGYDVFSSMHSKAMGVSYKEIPQQFSRTFDRLMQENKPVEEMSAMEKAIWDAGTRHISDLKKTAGESKKAEKPTNQNSQEPQKIDRATAEKIYLEAGKDTKKARELAKSRGYVW